MRLVWDWALFGSRTPLSAGSADEDFSFRAVPVGGGTSRKILDHATSLAATPDGALLAPARESGRLLACFGAVRPQFGRPRMRVPAELRGR
nr:hypothetical protein OG781_22450 [Streptomyces sp. NBC_00830]